VTSTREVVVVNVFQYFHLAPVVIFDFALDILVIPGIVWRMKDERMHVSNSSTGDVGSLREFTNCRKFTIEDLAHVFECTSFVQARISENLSEDISSQRGVRSVIIWNTDLGEIIVEFPRPTVHLRQLFCKSRC
jgi:hypothetical protein